jgi:ABC-type bacteriocin/lantibiotic exporter with double-glycine peptidase domain
MLNLRRRKKRVAIYENDDTKMYYSKKENFKKKYTGKPLLSEDDDEKNVCQISFHMKRNIDNFQHFVALIISMVIESYFLIYKNMMFHSHER